MAIPENLTREQYVFMAKLAEQAERYEEMAKYMEKLVVTTTTSGGELTVEERNLLSVAYKNVIGSLLASLRIVSSIEQKEEGRKNDHHVALARDYRGNVESKLSAICISIFKLLDSHLTPTASSSDSRVFYLKMKGDCHCCMADFKSGDERITAAEGAMKAYKAAQEIALKDLPPTHPIRLDLALNFSGFYYEILNSADKACSMASQAFEEAMAKLDTLSKEFYKDSTLIMQLLWDNLTRWISDQMDSDLPPSPPPLPANPPAEDQPAEDPPTYPPSPSTILLRSFMQTEVLCEVAKNENQLELTDQLRGMLNYMRMKFLKMEHIRVTSYKEFLKAAVLQGGPNIWVNSTITEADLGRIQDYMGTPAGKRISVKYLKYPTARAEKRHLMHLRELRQKRKENLRREKNNKTPSHIRFPDDEEEEEEEKNKEGEEDKKKMKQRQQVEEKQQKEGEQLKKKKEEKKMKKDKKKQQQEEEKHQKEEKKTKKEKNKKRKEEREEKEEKRKREKLVSEEEEREN